MRASTFTAAVILVIAACQSGVRINENAAQRSFKINHSLSSFEPGKEVYQIDAQKGVEIQTSDGGKILVAAGTFVDKKGQPVNAKLSYTPYHSASDVIASGIPMQANMNGKVGQFISDGMFKMEAEANGEAVQIADGKNIQVFQPSQDTKSDFQMWFFNQEKGVWEELSKRDSLYNTNQIAAVAQKMEIQAGPEIQKSETNSRPPVAYNPSKKILDLNFDSRKYPELTGYSRIMWQYSGGNPKQDPENNEWIFNEEWNDIKLTKIPGNNLDYNLEIDAGGKPFKTVVTPALTGKDLVSARAKYTQLLASADAEKQTVQDKKSTAEASKKLFSNFTVAKMGIYNCDRFYSDPEAKVFNTISELDNKTLSDEQSIYVITDNKKNVMQFDANTEMRIKPDIIDGIVTVAAGGVMATASAETIDELKSGHGGKVKLIFKKLTAQTGSLQNVIDRM